MEVFIDRDGALFQYVLDYVRDGEVYLPFTLPKEVLKRIKALWIRKCL